MMYRDATNILAERGFIVDRKVQSRLSIAQSSDEEPIINN
jgi:hypothetical protein